MIMRKNMLHTVNQTVHLLRIFEASQTRHIRLDQEQYLIGRSSHNDIVIDHRAISRQQAVLQRVSVGSSEEYCYRLQDGRALQRPSTNGTTINCLQYQEKDLQSGDKIIFGTVIYAVYEVISVPIGGDIISGTFPSSSLQNLEISKDSARQTLIGLSQLELNTIPTDLIREEDEMKTTSLLDTHQFSSLKSNRRPTSLLSQ
jgi:pSer/pThr/pTyr-binding forkhead associated (FHA) protein